MISRIYSVLIITALLLAVQFVNADDHTNARGIGMSRASLVSSSGIDAFGVNPANYNYKLIELPKNKLTKKRTVDPTNWNLAVLSVGGTYGSDLSFDFYYDYLSYLTVNRERFVGLFTDIAKVNEFKQEVLPAERTHVNYDFELKWFSLNISDKKWGGFNFTVTDKVGLNTNVYGREEAIPQFGVNPINDTTYSISNMSINQSEATAWWIRKYTAGYARQFDFKGFVRSISVGFTGGLVHGFGNIITNNSSINGNMTLMTRDGRTFVDTVYGHQDFRTQAALTDFFRDYSDGTESQFNFFPKPAGTGFSIDLGFNVQLGDNFGVAASVIDIGKITWDYNTFVNYDTENFAYGDFYLDPADPEYNQFVNDLEGLDSRDTVSTYETDLPTKYRFGVMYKYNEKFLAELNYIKGDNDLPGNSVEDVVAVGAEYYPLDFLPLRTGFSYGGPGTWSVALGAGLRFRNFVLDVGTNGLNHLINNERISFSLSTKITL